MVLDWLTSGRMSMGEEWVFSRYHSTNEIWIEGRRVAKDVMLLDDQVDPTVGVPPRTMPAKLAPYSCYAMIMLCGPLTLGTIERISADYNQISVFKTKAPADMVWSLSSMATEQGAIIRVAGKGTEGVRRWIGQALIGFRDTIGIDVYRKTFLYQ